MDIASMLKVADELRGHLFFFLTCFFSIPRREIGAQLKLKEL